jgi:hypothetical protein
MDINPLIAESFQKDSAALFDYFEKVVNLSREMGWGEEFAGAAQEELNAIGLRLGLSPVQAVLFCQILEGKRGYPISEADIAHVLHCSSIRMIKYASEFDALKEKHLIRSVSREGTKYFVPSAVIKALRNNEEYHVEDHADIPIEKFFDVVETFFDEKEGDTLTHYEFIFELKKLLDNNQKLPFVRKVKDLKLRTDDLIVFMYFCHVLVNTESRHHKVPIRDLGDLCENSAEFRRLKRSLIQGGNILCKEGIIVPVNDGGYRSRETFTLSEKAKKEYLAEIQLTHKTSKKQLGIFSYKKIKNKKLFYNKGEAEQIENLTTLLNEENYRAIKTRLAESGMRTGFACLFSGSPGTGKTETAFQIARLTERDIVEVDIAQTKSMWFGESEKRIKEIFSRYRSLVNTCEKGGKYHTPILLFNEADGVIGRRAEFAGRGKGPPSSSIDKTLNSMQNIILQEFENLKGILIATTNLASNLDPAFERRFLYKIEFGKPSAEARQNIWNAMIPSLVPGGAAELARRFDFSGGQIENIARKRAIELVLSGSEPDVETLARFCEQEAMIRSVGKTIGFRHE